jgi:hypothetical protein
VTVYWRARITRGFVRTHPKSYFVFGDNMAREGFGGQAAAMRGEPNSIGIPTKWRPARDEPAYFTDGDWDNADVRSAIVEAFILIEKAVGRGRDVYMPCEGIGTGRAELPKRAPRIYGYIHDRLAKLTDAIQ